MIYDVYWVRRLCGLTQVAAESEDEAAKKFYDMVAAGQVCDPDAELGPFRIQKDGIEESDEDEDDDDDDDDDEGDA